MEIVVVDTKNCLFFLSLVSLQHKLMSGHVWPQLLELETKVHKVFSFTEKAPYGIK